VTQALTPMWRATGDCAAAPAGRPLVSVIIPCYNYGRFLPGAISSVLSQPGVDVEVIVINDASTDDSAAVAKRAASDDDRVKLIDHERNQGHIAAYNNGFAIATGDYIVRLDADDLLTPGSLARATALFEQHPNVGLVYGHPRHFTAELPVPVTGPITSWTVWHGVDWLAERARRGVNCITTPEAMIRGEVHRAVGGLRNELKYAQDLEIWLRVASVSDVGHIDGVDQALHRDHAASMSATAGSEIMTDLGERRTVFDVLLKNPPGSDLEGSDDILETARRRLAVEALDTACRAYERGQVDRWPVEALAEFALETWPAARTLPQWRRLARRRAVGASAAKYAPPFVVSAARRRAVETLAYRKWERTGV
jgi:hypothetical protein